MAQGPEPAGGKQANGLTSCKVCCEPINPRALKCTKCGSYQDWSRHLLRWSALLVSLLALAPLWSLSSSVSKLAFHEKAARIEAAVTACNAEEVRVVFENSGELSAIVTGVDFSVLTRGEYAVPEVDIANQLSEGDILVVPNERPVKVVYRAFIQDEPTSFFPQQDSPDCRFRLAINWTDLKGNAAQLSRECRCR